MKQYTILWPLLLLHVCKIAAINQPTGIASSRSYYQKRGLVSSRNAQSRKQRSLASEFTIPTDGMEPSPESNDLSKANLSSSSSEQKATSRRKKLNAEVINELEIPSWVTSSYDDSRGLRQRGSTLSWMPREGEVDVYVTPTNSTKESSLNSMSMTLDPLSALRLLRIAFAGSMALGAALLGTLRFLAPMIVARRGLYAMLTHGQDWYRGRYLRTTVERIEDEFWRYYEMPAALRSLARAVSQILILFLLGNVMESMVGLSHAPCYMTNGGCHSWCGLLWIIAVIGTGHAFGAAMAVWGGPLRLQLEPQLAKRRPSRTPPGLQKILKHPRQLLQWLRDPEQWIRDVARQRRTVQPPTKPFQTDPMLFPATWEPLTILQMVVVSSEMNHNRQIMHKIMRQLLVQQALGDEWYRVLLCEKRVGLGLIVMGFYALSSIRLFWTVANQNNVAALFLMGPLFAVVVSGWMHTYIYMERRESKRRQKLNQYGHLIDDADRTVKEWGQVFAYPSNSMSQWFPQSILS